MARDDATARYRKFYTILLRLYPKPFRERFGEGMAQTFNDLCRERNETGRGLLGFTLRTIVETSAGIVRERMKSVMMQKNIVRIALATALILLVPLVAMQFTDQVSWDLADFVAGGTLLFGAGLAYALVARKAQHTAHRVAIGLAVAAALILCWMNLAVGLIGNENNPVNVLYFAVLGIGLVGAAIARFRPHGMARALFLTALAQALVPVIALTVSSPQGVSGESLTAVLGVNTFFVLLFVASALLFRRAT